MGGGERDDCSSFVNFFAVDGDALGSMPHRAGTKIATMFSLHRFVWVGDIVQNFIVFGMVKDNTCIV